MSNPAVALGANGTVSTVSLRWGGGERAASDLLDARLVREDHECHDSRRRAGEPVPGRRGEREFPPDGVLDAARDARVRRLSINRVVDVDAAGLARRGRLHHPGGDCTAPG
ncbi:hypothetical protein [Demequina litorisediminis]|uniref:hypothetical protein n=1 Tax=Demequina litorisediminis TaxID=1849022 RepID=UPI003D6724FA